MTCDTRQKRLIKRDDRRMLCITGLWYCARNHFNVYPRTICMNDKKICSFFKVLYFFAKNEFSMTNVREYRTRLYLVNSTKLLFVRDLILERTVERIFMKCNVKCGFVSLSFQTLFSKILKLYFVRWKEATMNEKKNWKRTQTQYNIVLKITETVLSSNFFFIFFIVVYFQWAK